MTIGQAIKEIRKRKRLSQAALAERAGITQTALSQIENGKRPGEKTFERLSEALGVAMPLIHLMTYEQKDVPASKQILYEKLFPVIKGLIFEIAGDDIEPKGKKSS
ncbi:MAG TPA: helix-turn-helix transcriptional regulator [Chitinophagaceae bacterium]|nr:helix-turn-helix transcriptional regulator [Chitinophagaceae bacterium]